MKTKNGKFSVNDFSCLRQQQKKRVNKGEQNEKIEQFVTWQEMYVMTTIIIIIAVVEEEIISWNFYGRFWYTNSWGFDKFEYFFSYKIHKKFSSLWKLTLSPGYCCKKNLQTIKVHNISTITVIMGFLIKMYCHKIYYHIIHENKPQLYSQKISPVELNYKNLRATRGLSHIFCSCENGSYIGNKVRSCRHRLSLFNWFKV